MTTLNHKTLIRGLSRPAMVFGVTLDYFACNAMLSLLLFIATNTFSTLLIFIPLHVIAAILCRLDPFISQLLLKRCLCLPGRLTQWWGCQTYAP